MRVDDFDFELPEDRIALEAAEPRDAARLLVVPSTGAGSPVFADCVVRDLPAILRPGDLLVLNDTRVAPVQLAGRRPARPEGGGGAVAVDVTLHKRLDPGPDGAARWRAFARPAKRLRLGDALDFGGSASAIVTRHDGAEVDLAFDIADARFFDELPTFGAPPLPPYIARRRETTPADEARYQTVYARETGSVAAPTAGLHFTEDLLARLDAAGVSRAFVTLHVGAGTYLPVTADRVEDHVMHAEWGEVGEDAAAAIAEAKARGGRIVPVGTTALRLIETAARAADGTADAIAPWRGETDIFITPGFDFRAADLLMTNFHLPRSTLFMLVAAFIGLDAARAAYAHAIAERYRFYSYGDACLFERAR
ncbi:MAG: tRNA preQ1(34) S-adenosylmethionine ribosyltransferase-isomerase QueA [Alphaproteobacteria bacterium]|nr:tRNA preQ1(34) S-adenosylmethionine ribosyltransferase-isomerase QueA [Alphaproteobacteria bacterium]